MFDFSKIIKGKSKLFLVGILVVLIGFVIFGIKNSGFAVGENEGQEQELKDVPLDITKVSLPKIHWSYGVRPSLLINPAGIVKITRARVLEINGDILKVKVWGMEFRVDISEAKIVKRPHIVCKSKNECTYAGLEVIPSEDAQIKVGDLVNIIGKVKDYSSYPILIKAKIVKNISRIQPIVKGLKILKEHPEKAKTIIKKKVYKKLKKTEKNPEQIRNQIKNILERLKQIQERIKAKRGD